MANLTSSRHIQSRKELFNKFHEVALLEGSIEPIQLHQIGISASPLDLDDEGHFPRYFLPMPAEKLAEMTSLRPKLDANRTSRETWEESSMINRGAIISAEVAEQAQNPQAVRDGGSCVMDSTPWTRDGYCSVKGHFHQALSEGDGEYHSRWRLQARYDTYEHSYPHLMGAVHNDQTMGEPLVRSDLLCAMGLIIDRMGQDWTQSHLIFPIMLLSFCGARARIIHAHFDSNIFHFRYSRYYDFTKMDKETIDLFVRWLSNEPIGDTAIVEATDANKSPFESHAYAKDAGLSVNS